MTNDNNQKSVRILNTHNNQPKHVRVYHKQGNKNRILLIAKALYEESDEAHPLSAGDLIQYLEQNGLSVERKTIYDDIKTLQQSGMDILFTRTPTAGYFLASRLFEAPELRLLVDAVQASHFISQKKSRQLIEKLSHLAGRSDASRLLSGVIYPKNKSSNEAVFYTIDRLRLAIEEKRAVSFLYFDLDIKKKKQYRRQSRRYDLIPLATLWENQRYYCIGFDPQHQSFSHYRIDKMDQLEIKEKMTDTIPFDLEEYSSRVFGMFHGKAENVVLQVDRSLLNVIYDEFGQDVLISEVTESHFTVNLLIAVAPPFISWLFQFTGRIRVLAPESLIEQIKKTAEETLAVYSVSELTQ